MTRTARDVLTLGFLAIGLALAVLAFFWFSGRIEDRSQRDVEVRFADVTGLRVGDPVEVLGLPRGRVAALELDGDRVACRVRLDRRVLLSENAAFAIRSVSYLGSDRYLMVTPGRGPAAAEDAVFEGVNEALDLEATFLRLDRVVAQLDPAQLRTELRNTIQDLVESLDRPMARFETRLGSFDRSLGQAGEQLERVSTSLDSLAGLLRPGSTASRLLSSDDLYEELRRTNLELQALLADIKANPKRYFKVSLF